ncbi:MAG: hypothetical protein OXI32_03335 [bacterium]|nr:hypothetical protein [bacterium]
MYHNHSSFRLDAKEPPGTQRLPMSRRPLLPLWLLAAICWALLTIRGLTIRESLPRILGDLASQTLSDDTRRMYRSSAKRLVLWLHREGITCWGDIDPQSVDDWCQLAIVRRDGTAKAPAHGTVRGRQNAALATLRSARRLGAPIDPEHLVGPLVPHTLDTVSARPLTAAEADLLRRLSRSSLLPTPQSVLVALALSGGTPKDLAAVRKRDINVETKTVRFSGEFERVNPISRLDADTLRRYLDHDTSLGDDDLLCTAGRATSPKKARSVGERLHHALRHAGLSRRPGVTVRSLRLTGAKNVLDQDGLVAAAVFMGAPSLDSAARALGCDWRGGDG